MVNDYLHFNQISEIIGIPVEQIRSLNPQYRRDIIPASKEKAYSLVLPQDEISAYLENEITIHDHRRTEFFPNNQIVNPQGYIASHSPSDIKGRDKVIYTVKSGDNLGLIASWFRVRSSDLKYWNGIKKNFIKVGQKLTVYVPEGQGDHYAKLNKKSYSEKQKSLKEKPQAATVQNLAAATPKKTQETKPIVKPEAQAEPKEANVASKEQSDKAEFVYYKVLKGDNFWTIAKKFPGVTNLDIMKLNNITKATSLKVGQILKILPKA